jgi:DNA-directed RNA polymerase subunit M/transcription elongation factor TFIIS
MRGEKERREKGQEKRGEEKRNDDDDDNTPLPLSFGKKCRHCGFTKGSFFVVRTLQANCIIFAYGQ